MKRALLAAVIAASITIFGAMVAAQAGTIEVPRPLEVKVEAPVAPVAPAVFEAKPPEAPKAPEIKAPEAPRVPDEVKAPAAFEVKAPDVPNAPVSTMPARIKKEEAGPAEVKAATGVEIQEMKFKDVDFKIGAAITADMKVKKELKKFKIGEPIFYSVFSKKNKKLEVDMTIAVNVISVDGGVKMKVEELRSVEKELKRPANQISIAKAGKYVLELSAGEKILARKVFEVAEEKKAEKK